MAKAQGTLTDTPLNTENVDDRLPIVILADTSNSMKGAPIDELNAGLLVFKEATEGNELAESRLEVLLMTFGGTPLVVNEFTPVVDFQPTSLVAMGGTPMGGALLLALQKIEERKDLYRAHGIDYFRPIMIMITDGEPTDTEVWDSAVEALVNAVVAKKVHFQAIGVEKANMELLSQMSPTISPIKLHAVEKFKDYFEFLSRSSASSDPHGQLAGHDTVASYASVHERR
jgi:uncharacterized protein YegL